MRDEGQADFSSRFFGPAVGIDEDPVTGSAHCALAPLFMKRCGGKRRLVGYQAPARGGEVVSDVAGPLVKLSGRATAVMAGVVGSRMIKGAFVNGGGPDNAVSIGDRRVGMWRAGSGLCSVPVRPDDGRKTPLWPASFCIGSKSRLGAPVTGSQPWL